MKCAFLVEGAVLVAKSAVWFHFSRFLAFAQRQHAAQPAHGERQAQLRRRAHRAIGSRGSGTNETTRRGAGPARAHDMHNKPRELTPGWSPDSPWPSAVARATQVHRAECSQPGRAFATIIHAGSARALATRGPAPSMSPPGNRRSLLSGADRRQQKSQKKRRRTGKTSGLR